MSDVTPINGAPSAALSPLTRRSQSEVHRDAAPARSGDKVELSRAALYISQLVSRNEIREDLVDRVKQQIADGTYETPQKLDAALEELLSDL